MKGLTRTKQGYLRPYALECGYQEKKERNGVETTLWKYAGCYGYHVRQHDFNTHTRIFWETFETLTEARQRFRKA